MVPRAEEWKRGDEWLVNAAGMLSIVVATIEVAIDWATWVELNVSIVYSVPLLLAGMARSRRLLWGLLAVLICMSFAVYEVQLPPQVFTLREPMFINRVLATSASVITACLLQVLILATDKVALQDVAIEHRNLELELANRELVRREALILTQNEELERRRSAAEEASARKTQFVAAISHDIRTPVNAIHLMAELMCRTADNPTIAAELPDISRRLQANAVSLVDLVSDVLDIARLDSAQVELHSTRFSLNDLLAEQLRALLPLAKNKGLSLRLEVPEQPLWLTTDRTKLARIVMNLLANAIKYTDRGEITATAITDPDRSVSIEVRDTGSGIPEEHLGAIFDEYTQLNNPERDRNKGWGLGLPICHRLTGLLGGVISVTSQLNQGTTFTVRLPGACRSDEGERLAAQCTD